MKRLLMLMLMLASANAYTQKPYIILDKAEGWHKIGSVTASFQIEKDGITILGSDVFKALKLKVTDARIYIYHAEVYYESGDSEQLNVKTELQPGEETRAFSLGKNLSIKKVVFTYKSAPSMDDDKATVELYGLK